MKQCFFFFFFSLFFTDINRSVISAAYHPGGYSPMKMTAVLVGIFQKNKPSKVPESHFMGVASNLFTPLRGTNSEITNYLPMI